MTELYQDKTVFLLGAGSDIGARLASMFAARGARVVGAYRSEASVAALRGEARIDLIPCDAARAESVRSALAAYAELKLPWDIFNSAYAARAERTLSARAASHGM